MDTTRHTGHVVLVTGAAFGIGRATALRFAREGASVYGIDMDEEGLAPAADEFGAAGGDAGYVGACMAGAALRTW
jgi:3-oxoacyl-[acyl-carrier protein] reductase